MGLYPDKFGLYMLGENWEKEVPMFPPGDPWKKKCLLNNITFQWQLGVHGSECDWNRREVDFFLHTIMNIQLFQALKGNSLNYCPTAGEKTWGIVGEQIPGTAPQPIFPIRHIIIALLPNLLLQFDVG